MKPWKPAKVKLTKAQKNRGRELRDEIEWLENKISSNSPLLNDVQFDFSDKISYRVVVGGRKQVLVDQLQDMKNELRELYK